MAALKDSLTTQLTPVVPALMGILQKINVNFLSDTPDKKLEKQYRDEIADVFSKALDSLSGLFYNVSEMLTPEQKAKLRKAMIDSRTILDAPGANQLVGRGDMLFSQGNDLVRVQCAFVDTPEVENIVHHISDQQGYPTAFYLPEYINPDGEVDLSGVDMGEIWVKGSNALPFLQKVTSNDVSKLAVGKAQYSCLPNGKGGIVDDILVYRYETEKYLLVVNASNVEKDWNWLNTNNTENAELENASDWMAQLAIQGPKATTLLQQLTTVNLSEIPYYSFATGIFADVPDVILSNTGYTGAGGFELYFYPEHGEKIWNALFEAGKDFGLKPIGLGARDTLRLEKGFCLYGNDIDDTTSPIEAGLGWITKFAEGKDFIDRNLLEKQKNEGVAQKLVSFELTERGIPRHAVNTRYPLLLRDETIPR